MHSAVIIGRCGKVESAVLGQKSAEHGADGLVIGLDLLSGSSRCRAADGDGGTAPFGHVGHFGTVKLRTGASGRFAETETFVASARIGFLQIESARFARVARRSVNVLLAETLDRVLVANLLTGTAHVAVAQLTVREGPVAESTAFACA